MAYVLTATVRHRRLLRSLDRIYYKMDNMQPVLDGAVAPIVVGAIAKNFERKAAPVGMHGAPLQRWQDLHEITVALRKAAGTWKGKRRSILDETGVMKKSARASRASRHSVTINCTDTRPSSGGSFGTRAEMHQWGGEEMSSVTQTGLATIPARPFMYIDMPSIQAVVRVVANWMFGGSPGRSARSVS